MANEIGISVAKSASSSQYLQLDDTDKLAVSQYAKATAAGDEAVSNNTEAAVLALEENTLVTRTSTDQTNTNARGMILHVNTAGIVGTTAEYTPGVQAKFNDGSYVTIWTAAAALTVNGDATYVLYPGAAGGNVTEVDGIPIPRTWRGVITVGGTTNGSHNMDTLMDVSLIL